MAEDKGPKLLRKHLLFNESALCTIHCAVFAVRVGHRIPRYCGLRVLWLSSRPVGKLGLREVC